jgi:hypothetical protein
MGNLILAQGGDSIAARSGAWPYQALGVTSVGNATYALNQASCIYYSSNIVFVDLSVAGATLAGGGSDANTMGSTYADHMVSVKNIVGCTHRKYMFCQAIGSNDAAIDGYGTVAAYADAVAANIQARKTAGFDLTAICSLLPRNDATMTELNRAAYNALVTNSSWRSARNIDYCIDLASEATMGLYATTSNTTYYVDGIHPTTAGYALLAPIAAAVYNAAAATA